MLGDGSSALGLDRQTEGISLVTEMVGSVVPGWLRPAPACHPKIWELVQYLQQYRYGVKQFEIHMSICLRRKMAG